ncbi:MAG: ATP-dependent DNA helicase RecG [Burkholderiaceae bacterium]
MPTRAAAAKPGQPSGPQRALEKLGLLRDIDLALHLPLRYEDETRIVPISQLRDGSVAQVEGVVRDCQVQVRARRQLVVRIHDGSHDLVLRFLHFYASTQRSFAAGQRVRVRGEARGGFFGLEMVHPSFKRVDTDTPLASALTPVYPSSAQLPQAYLRKAVAAALARADLDELLPAAILPTGLMGLREALNFLHHPDPQTSLATLQDRNHPAWQRLKFEELLAQQLSQLQAKRERARQRAPAFGRSGDTGRAGPGTPQRLVQSLLAALPFALTPAQRRVLGEIGQDLRREVPMHRLLQGDVGSGKTVVAALAAATAIQSGWQCALMAPTEILAEQHLRKLVGWLTPLGVEVAWLTGSRKGRARDAMLARVASGEAALVVGTHAVIQEQVEFARLGLAIIDEQHRFGVQQRLALRAKLEAQDLEPHTLMMSATPIPRTLAMALFADLDISTIDALPPGRLPVQTRLFADTRRLEVIARIRDQAELGRQIYWVCPLVEESEMLDLQNATATHLLLSSALPGQSVGLLHGRLSAAQKAAVMAQFAAGQLAVLVATTVIEVGVDVPNASLMVVEHAERFGLSQLHQLRGRVGRGSVASTCVLLYGEALSDSGKARLKAMLETQDGFEIARRDLEIRGPGEFLGSRQSGASLLRFADIALDEALLHHARHAAQRLLDRHVEAARRHVARWLESREHFLKA